MVFIYFSNVETQLIAKSIFFFIFIFEKLERKTQKFNESHHWLNLGAYI